MIWQTSHSTFGGVACFYFTGGDSRRKDKTMSKRTDIEIRNFHLEKAKQAENRIKQKEKRMKEQQRKKVNSIKFTLGGMLFKYFGDDLVNLPRKELEAYIYGLSRLFGTYEELVARFKSYGDSSLKAYREEMAEESRIKNLRAGDLDSINQFDHFYFL